MANHTPTAPVRTKEGGFALLYTLLVVTIFLSITATIYTILLKELKISSFGKESQVAYYASESGAECVYYWVLRGTVFDGTEQITCAGQSVTADAEVELDFAEGCALVTVAPNLIRSHGYNTCETTRLRIERGLQVVY